MDTLNENQTITDEMFTEQYWYREFERLLQIEPNFTRANLEPFDEDFKLARAINHIPNVKKGIAGIKTVRKVCMALQKLIEQKQSTEVNPETIRTRQKLIPS